MCLLRRVPFLRLRSRRRLVFVWKSAFYTIAEGIYMGKPPPTLFTTQDNNYHAFLKRASVNAYSMTALSELEPHVTRCVQLLVMRIDEVTMHEIEPLDISA